MTDPKIPAEIRVGHTRFKKGVSLLIVQEAIDRLHARLQRFEPRPTVEQKRKFQEAIAEVRAGFPLDETEDENGNMDCDP